MSRCDLRTVYIVVSIVIASSVLAALDARPHYAQRSGRRRASARPYLVRLPRSVDPTGVTIRYFLSGSFGGYGGFVSTRADQWEYEIDTSVEGVPAEQLKAVIYCPGHEVVTIDEPSLISSPERSRAVTPKPLAAVAFSGRAVLPARVKAGEVRIEVGYTPVWECEFFGLMDCLLTSTAIASADAAGDGRFTVALPNFALDPTISSFKRKGKFDFRVVDRRSGRTLFRLKPDEGGSRFDGIPVEVEYPGERMLIAEAVG